MGDEPGTGATEEAWREQQRAVYSSDSTELLARQQEPVARALVEAARLRAGDRVLDIGAGTGNVALAAARLGAVVTAVDLTPHQVEIGARRTADAGLDIAWRVADAEALPCPDRSIDVALSSFGVVYAARPPVAAAEMLRVLGPGGRALFTAYPVDSFNGQMVGVVNGHLPGGGAEPLVSEHAWADPEVLAGWFPHCRVAVEPRTWVPPQTFASMDAWWLALREMPVVRLLHDVLTDDDLAAFRRRAIEIRTRFARTDADGTITLVNDYVVVRVETELTRR